MNPDVPPSSAPSSDAALSRAEGEDSRRRLISAGLRLFAEKGFAATSVRELAQAAGVNVAAISYYFGDKVGLYRAVFMDPAQDPQEELNRLAVPDLTLEALLDGYFQLFLAPLSDGEMARLCVKLRMREMLEPTGLWQEEVRSGIQPMHNLLVGALCRHMGLPQPDDDVQRLAFSISALGVYLHVGQDVMDAVAPQLARYPQAVPEWRLFLVRQAVAMVRSEHTHRQMQENLNK
jgi:TetR/AcrR family transcriptional regulator, regulator of cefoperazone and chloramphenicol sensitivity